LPIILRHASGSLAVGKKGIFPVIILHGHIDILGLLAALDKGTHHGLELPLVCSKAGHCTYVRQGLLLILTIQAVVNVTNMYLHCLKITIIIIKTKKH
jgi:hypothetical protein